MYVFATRTFRVFSRRCCKKYMLLFQTFLQYATLIFDIYIYIIHNSNKLNTNIYLYCVYKMLKTLIRNLANNLSFVPIHIKVGAKS